VIVGGLIDVILITATAVNIYTLRNYCSSTFSSKIKEMLCVMIAFVVCFSFMSIYEIIQELHEEITGNFFAAYTEAVINTCLPFFTDFLPILSVLLMHYKNYERSFGVDIAEDMNSISRDDIS
jgi:hypothetical protein